MKSVNLNLDKNGYEIIIDRGLLNNICDEIQKVYKGLKLSVITDDNVYGIYGERLGDKLRDGGYDVTFTVVPHGEKSKSIEMLCHIYDSLIENNMTRGDMIIAFGGGVVGDLAGFAAATYLRGIDYIQVPTSLLAQIDSSVGGKVSVNLNQGKNLAGNFYQPKRVLIDIDMLQTLPERFVRDGLGEVIKYACIGDERLFDMLMNMKSIRDLDAELEHIIYTCCSMKRDMVIEDERDTGIRMMLNFGHTLGHAVEKYFNYETYSHGEAVALGMYHITKKSEENGYTEEGTAEKTKKLLINFDIGYELPQMDMGEIVKTISMDKKNISDKMNLILLKKIGQGFIENISVSDANKFFTQ